MKKTNAIRLLLASATALSSVVVMTAPASARRGFRGIAVR